MGPCGGIRAGTVPFGGGISGIADPGQGVGFVKQRRLLGWRGLEKEMGCEGTLES